MNPEPMIVTLSPAKSLDFSETNAGQYHVPRMLDQSKKLVDVLRKKSAKKLQGLMQISEDLAILNAERYQAFEVPFNPGNSKQAILAFDGDAYTGLDARNLDESDLEYADMHVRILSGLYGLLRPMDLIQPYRLEMGTKLKTRRGPNLYQFWKDRITDLLKEDLRETDAGAVLNLASNEYWKSVNVKKLDVPVYTAKFLENRGGTYRFISYNGKKARGQMTRFIIKNRIQNPKDIRAFDADDYIYNEEMSGEQEFVFTKG